MQTIYSGQLQVWSSQSMENGKTLQIVHALVQRNFQGNLLHHPSWDGKGSLAIGFPIFFHKGTAMSYEIRNDHTIEMIVDMEGEEFVVHANVTVFWTEDDFSEHQSPLASMWECDGFFVNSADISTEDEQEFYLDYDNHSKWNDETKKLWQIIVNRASEMVDDIEPPDSNYILDQLDSKEIHEEY